MRDLGTLLRDPRSDGGAMVGRELAVLDPEGFPRRPRAPALLLPVGAPGEMDGFGEGARRARAPPVVPVRGRYNTMNASRPQTMAAGLADSPVAVLAYHELFESFGTGRAS
nr:hypothetical protein [Cellulosimicrobium sp. MM]